MNKQEKIKRIIKKGLSYNEKNDKLYFIPAVNDISSSAGNSLFGNIQSYLKRWGKFYYFLFECLKPVWVNNKSKEKLNWMLEKYDQGSVILNLGSGPRILKGRKDIINIDIFEFREVDIFANAMDLPFEDNSVDLIINQAMLEHVDNPNAVVQEMHRVMKCGGEAYCYLPFMQPYHAAPYDFFRWTVQGIRDLFKKFDKIEIGIGSGPTSGMLWVFQEWVAIMLSFGSKKMHDLVLILILFVTAPIKIMDIIMVYYPYAEKIASGFYVTVKKSM